MARLFPIILLLESRISLYWHEVCLSPTMSLICWPDSFLFYVVALWKVRSQSVEHLSSPMQSGFVLLSSQYFHSAEHSSYMWTMYFWKGVPDCLKGNGTFFNGDIIGSPRKVSTGLNESPVSLLPGSELSSFTDWMYDCDLACLITYALFSLFMKWES